VRALPLVLPPRVGAESLLTQVLALEQVCGRGGWGELVGGPGPWHRLERVTTQTPHQLPPACDHSVLTIMHPSDNQVLAIAEGGEPEGSA
jgi:hypothetical protein